MITQPRQNLTAERLREGFTLVELLIVIVIIGLLVALLLPAIQSSRESARRLQCSQHISQVVLAVHSYQMSHRMLPYGTLDSAPRIDNRPIGYHHGWIGRVLPHLERKNTYRAIDTRFSVYHARNVPARTMEIQVLQCASSFTTGQAHSNYAGVHHSSETPIAATNNGSFILNKAIRRRDIADGLSQTLFIGEKQVDGGIDLGWMSGTRATLRNLGLGINGIGGGTALNGAMPLNVDATGAPLIGDNAWELPGLPKGAQGIINRHNAGDSNYETTPTPTGTPTGTPIGNGEPVDAVEEDLQTGTGMMGLMASDDNSKRGKTPQLYVGGFGSNHPGGANFAFGDGHVKIIPASVDLTALGQMGDRADGKLLRKGR